MNPGLAALSVDLDELDLYDAVHARVGRSPKGWVYARGLVRALDFAQAVRVPLTLFVVSRDLALPGAPEALASAVAAGHAVESHSRTHPNDLVRRTHAELDGEIAGSFDAIEHHVGARPVGFRAPGYTLSAAVLRAVERAGGTFDSSVLPSPVYYAAKLAMLGLQALRGRRSSSIASSPRQWVARPEPTRFDLGDDRSILELPISVTRLGRLPLIGTSLGWAGARAASRCPDAVGPTPLLNLELHGIDFLDARDAPGLDFPELARPLPARLAAFRAAVEAARARGRRFVTLREAATSLAPRVATSPCI